MTIKPANFVILLGKTTASLQHVGSGASMPVLARQQANYGTRVTISQAGRVATTADAAEKPTKTKAPLWLQDLFEGVDFRHMTPLELTTLAGNLRKRGHFTQYMAARFTGIEMDTEIPRDRDTPIDIVEHFKLMQSGTEEEYRRRGVTMLRPLQMRTEVTEELKRLVSWTDTKW